MRGGGSRAEISEEGVCAACSAKLNTLRRQQAGARRGRRRRRRAERSGWEARGARHHLVRSFARASAQSGEEPAGRRSLGC